MTKLRTLLTALACTATLALTGCFDDDDDDQTPIATPTEVPDSALVSATAYTNFVGSLTNSETAEPLSVAKITGAAPFSDTTEPLPVP